MFTDHRSKPNFFFLSIRVLWNVILEGSVQSSIITWADLSQLATPIKVPRIIQCWKVHTEGFADSVSEWNMKQRAWTGCPIYIVKTLIIDAFMNTKHLHIFKINPQVWFCSIATLIIFPWHIISYKIAGSCTCNCRNWTFESRHIGGE